MTHPDQGGQHAGRPRGTCPLTARFPNHLPGVLQGCTCDQEGNHAEHIVARLRADSLAERVRAGMPDAYGPNDLPDGSGWRLTLEDGSVLMVIAESHDCPKEAFLQDPITEHYGVGAEMLHLITCKHCEAEEAAR